MARIYRGKHDPARQMRRSRLLMLLCWPLALLAVGLTALLYWQSGGRLLSLATSWRESFTAWAVAPGAVATFPQEWLAMLWQAAEIALQGVGWCIWGLTMALPGLLGLLTAILLIRLFAPALRQYRQLRKRVLAVRSAMKLLSPMPDSCHIFQHKNLLFDGGTTQTELILVSTGGVVVMEVRGGPGIIEGCVTDAVLYRRDSEGDVEKLRNPARRAVSLVTQLGAFFASQEISVRVIPCVIFVHPDASVYVNPADPLNAGGRRAHISSCVITDAVSFWDDLGREYASGRLLPQGMVDSILGALRNAPECAVEE